MLSEKLAISERCMEIRLLELMDSYTNLVLNLYFQDHCVFVSFQYLVVLYLHRKIVLHYDLQSSWMHHAIIMLQVLFFDYHVPVDGDPLVIYPYM